MKKVFLIVGLGNPDKKYLNTYHNLGFLTADCLCSKLSDYCERFGIKSKKEKSECRASTCEFEIFGKKIIIAKPLTYMNLSGKSVLAFKSKYSLDNKQILLIADDYDLLIGTFRFREIGSGGTHNGLKNVVETIGKDFPRIRIGIGREKRIFLKTNCNEIKDYVENVSLLDYVLTKFDDNSKKIFEQVIDEVTDFIIKKIIKLPKENYI